MKFESTDAAVEALLDAEKHLREALGEDYVATVSDLRNLPWARTASGALCWEKASKLGPLSYCESYSLSLEGETSKYVIVCTTGEGEGRRLVFSREAEVRLKTPYKKECVKDYP